ncbi:cyclic AMP-responsive element-binding protein 1 isoform X3 [Gopherus flavomarginatus]|uniref:cyclic AMP-responsive element-binding protein 1 isoform X3 n=1 Tax=Gopherus flavomarginatus TaxID=286002 RepID=UPI0021CC22B9|nr:cyclic AMP-responsive element-binding protein 1 isoform X3 [Gopherus flavomarginatus]
MECETGYVCVQTVHEKGIRAGKDAGEQNGHSKVKIEEKSMERRGIRERSRRKKRARSQQENHQLIAITQGGAIQLANNGTDGVQGLQTLTMTNAAATQPGTTILQYAQTTDGQQILVPSNQVVVQAASGDVQTYQIRTAPTSTIAPGVVMASSPALPTQPAEEAARKREVRLMKNREAARECRRKKKEYVKCLENRVAVLENQNKTLIEELKALKDLYCHKSD